MTEQQIHDICGFLRNRREEMANFVAKLARHESPSTQPGSQMAVQDILKSELEKNGYYVFHIPGRKTGGHLYARPQLRVRGAPVQLMVGHCDTVWPIGTLEKMPVQVDKDTIHGPGVYDMKGGLAQMIFALNCLQALSMQPEVTPVLLINSDEEIGSHESGPYIRRLAKIADRAFVLEPGLEHSGKLKTARKGVGRFTVVVKGRPAHAGLDPGKGASAIVELSYIIQELFAMNDLERGVSVNVGMVDGGVRPNVVAPEGRAVVDVRVLTQEDAERITSEIKQLQPRNPEVTLEIDGGIGRPPMERTPRNRALWKRAQQAARELDLVLEEGVAGGGSDGNTTSLYTATLDGLGAIGDGAHAPHEFAYIDKLLERTALLVLLLMGKAMNA